MNFLRLFLLSVSLVFLSYLNLFSQRCESWSDPVALSDSLEDHRNPVLVHIQAGNGDYFVFWERTLDVFGSEIVYMDYYNQVVPETIVLAEGFYVTNPQVISMWNWYPQTDTLAYVFYQTDQNGNEDIYFTIMTSDGFTQPVPFVNSALDEKHLRVSRSGGMVWQEGDIIMYSRLNQNSSGYFFEPATVIDEGNCMNPIIHNASYYEHERFMSWEKGDQDSAEVWYIMWNYQTGEWDDPVLLFDDGAHSNMRSTSGYEYMGWSASLVSDWRDSNGDYHISAYDFDEQYEFLSEFTQTIPFEPDLFTVDYITQDYLGFGYFSFRHEEGMGNYDIYSTDWSEISPWFSSYCRLDSTETSEGHPFLFQAADYGWYFDLVCIWESFRNGHRQLFTSKTEVVIGSVPETLNEGNLNVKTYPNPGSDQITFEFDMKSAANVKLSIFNHLGQRVAVLMDGEQSAGLQQVQWDPEGIPAGIYFYRLSAVNGQLSTGKLVLK